MSKFSRPERVLEIVRRRLGGEPVSLIAEDMGVSRTYIYSVLSQMPKEKKPPGKEKKKANFSGSQDLEIVMDYLALNPSQRRMTEFGKTGTDELVIQRIALMHDLPEEQISEILYRVAARTFSTIQQDRSMENRQPDKYAGTCRYHTYTGAEDESHSERTGTYASGYCHAGPRGERTEPV